MWTLDRVDTTFDTAYTPLQPNLPAQTAHHNYIRGLARFFTLFLRVTAAPACWGSQILSCALLCINLPQTIYPTSGPVHLHFPRAFPPISTHIRLEACSKLVQLMQELWYYLFATFRMPHSSPDVVTSAGAFAALTFATHVHLRCSR